MAHTDLPRNGSTEVMGPTEEGEHLVRHEGEVGSRSGLIHCALTRF